MCRLSSARRSGPLLLQHVSRRIKGCGKGLLEYERFGFRRELRLVARYERVDFGIVEHAHVYESLFGSEQIIQVFLFRPLVGELPSKPRTEYAVL